MIARIHWEGIERRAGALLMIQPLLSTLTFYFERGPFLVEANLALLAVLVALGSESERTRERMEYLAHLPRSLRSTELVALAVAVGTLLAAASLHWLAELTGGLDWLAQHLTVDPRRVIEWRPHLFRWPWLNLAGIPLGAFALTVALLRRRKTSRPSERPGFGQIVVFLLGCTVLTLGALLLWGGEVGSVSHHDLAQRNLPGLVGLILAATLLHRIRAGSLTRGIDAFPQEEVPWDS